MSSNGAIQSICASVLLFLAKGDTKLGKATAATTTCHGEYRERNDKPLPDSEMEP
jgi:hypothetical protein